MSSSLGNFRHQGGDILTRLDILNLEWPNSIRDRNIVGPVLAKLEVHHSLKVRSRNMFLGYLFLLFYRPKVLIISSATGALINHRIALFAKRMGTKVVTLISEGNIIKEYASEFLWGNNREKNWFYDKMLVWNENTRTVFSELCPEAANSIRVVGATGFDRYRLLSYPGKDELWKKTNRKFDGVVGIAAWAFDFIAKGAIPNEENLSDFNRRKVEIHRTDLPIVRSAYRELALKFPNVLFVAKFHTASRRYSDQEFTELEGLENVVFYGKSWSDPFSISDLINFSDIWIAYDSTTQLEAWLLKKPTILLNPTTEDFARPTTYKGSLVVKSANEISAYVNEFFTKGSIEDFNKKASIRTQLLQELIGFDDGLCHERAATEIMEVWKTSSSRLHLELKDLGILAKETIKFATKALLAPFQGTIHLYWKLKVDTFRQQYQEAITKKQLN